MENKSLGASLKSLFAAIAIPLCIVAGILIYMFILGDGSHFEGGDNENAPKKGDYLAIVYKGGAIVPVLIALFLMAITFAIERALTIWRASGRGNTDNFLRRIKVMLENNDIDAAIAECDRQKGSIANVVRAGLVRYKKVFDMPGLDKEQKLAAIQKELEEATALELPMLERNLVVIATLASTAVLIGLFGTVLGMIKAFEALATAGAPDAVALANGIAEALINTAFGIGTSALSIILYNYFTSRIDAITYRIDEAGFSIAQSFNEHYHD